MSSCTYHGYILHKLSVTTWNKLRVTIEGFTIVDKIGKFKIIQPLLQNNNSAMYLQHVHSEGTQQDRGIILQPTGHYKHFFQCLVFYYPWKHLFDTLIVPITESLVPTIMDKFLWDIRFYLSPVQSNLDYSDFFFGSNCFILIELTYKSLGLILF